MAEIDHNERHHLRQTKALKQAILDSLPAHIAVLDKNGIIVAVNDPWKKFAEENGLPESESVCAGTSYIAVCQRAADMADPFAREALEGIQSVLQGKREDFTLEYPCHSPTQNRWFQMTVVHPHFNGLGAIIIHANVTERRCWEEKIKELVEERAAYARKLEVLNNSLKTFNYTVSHDLRTPLNRMILRVQMIEQLHGNQFNEECKKDLHGVYESVLQMNDLITTLMDFSELSCIDIYRQNIDLGVVAQEVALELSQSEPERKVQFSIATGIMVNCDPKLAKLVLMNLLGNAWKFTSKKEEAIIEFGARDIAGKTTCFVRDNGPGFDDSQIEKLFTPFQRLRGSEEHNGHGIGLATVERIVARHGGTVWAESTPCRGAVFFFTL